MTNWIKYLLIGLVAVVTFVALAGPLGPVPGVRLGGNATPVPADWTTVSLPDEVQLKPSGGLFPRVVNIWIVELNNALYVFGAKDGGWTTTVQANPIVELRINDQTFTLKATPVESPGSEIYDQYIARYAASYPEFVESIPQGDALTAQGTVFRLTGAGSDD